jgi:hypothetical protein
LSGFWLIAPVALLAIFDTEVLILLLGFAILYGGLWFLAEKILSNRAK